MKYRHKCCCTRQATKQYGNLWLCEDCYKEVRRYRPKAVWGERLVASLGQGCAVYRDYPIRIK